MPRKKKNASPAETPPATPVALRRRGRPAKPKEEIPLVAGIPVGEVAEIPLVSINMEDTEMEFRVDRKVKDLVADIQHNGQQFPVILRKLEGQEKYQLVSGFRRCRSIIQLGWPSVKAIIRTDLDDDAAFRISFLENERRKSLTGVDKAHAIVKLRMRGKTDGDVMEIYGIGKKQLGRYEKVSQFPQVLKDAISDGRIQTTHGMAIMKVFEDNPGKVDMETWIQRSQHEALSVRQLVRTMNAELGKRKSQGRILEHREGGGFRIWPVRFDPTTTSKEARERMKEKLIEAIAVLDSADQ